MGCQLFKNIFVFLDSKYRIKRSTKLQNQVQSDQQSQQSQDPRQSRSNTVEQIKHKKNTKDNLQLQKSNNSIEDVSEQWKGDCSKFKYDLIQNVEGIHDNVLLFENIQFYYSKINSKTHVQQSNLDWYEIEGFIYQTKYDKQFNPNYKLQKGTFLINLKESMFLLNGKGIEYQGKSQFVKHNGEFAEGVFISELNNTIKKQYQPQNSNNSRIIIRDVETGYQLNSQNNKKKQSNQIIDSWCKYNQLISNNDLNILEQKRWMTSSIIDSYVLMLNLKSEQEYFNLELSKRKEVKRLLLIPSSFTTNFGANFDQKKAKSLLEQELLEYSKMNFEITKIYKRIAFPINQRNFHWYLLLFDAECNSVQIYDSAFSLADMQSHDKKLIKTLAEVLKIKIKEKPTYFKSSKQSNGYSCGYHVCNFMKFLQEGQCDSRIVYKYEEDQIIKILKSIIIKNK